MRILGIETSCDETAVCVIEAEGELGDFQYKVLGNALISQAKLHEQYGGVFPNLAKREHEKNLVPLLTKALMDSGLAKDGNSLADITHILEREKELQVLLSEFLKTHGKPEVDAIAVTHGPGLEPALWVGINFAKALAHAWQVPIVPVNHMEGHVILSALTGGKDEIFNSQFAICNKPKFPMLSLLISGGHTELVLSKEFMRYELIGQTRDDAVGEAFDKVARLMGLPYPGGPEIDRLATEARGERFNLSHGLTTAQERLNLFHVVLPRPMIDSDNYDFSFAGLKTAVRKVVEANQPLTDEKKMEIALEFENACAEVLVAKTMRAIEEFGVETLVVGGGVSANMFIRESLVQAIKDYGYSTKLFIPPRELATDNALMIALAGYFRACKKEFAEPDSIRANGNLKLA